MLKSGRGTIGKQAVLSMKQRKGRAKAMSVEGEDKATIHSAILANIERGSTIYTDDHKGYRDIGGTICKHKTVKHSAKEYVNGTAHTNSVESVWSVIKRDYNGVCHNWSQKC